MSKQTAAHALIISLGAMFICACQPTEQSGRVIRFWHFWSEPAQRTALQSIIHEFERIHPDVKIESTDLSWADGKSKLQLAFNAGTEPDVVHLGLDWFAEFQRSSVFMRLPDSLSKSALTIINDTAVTNYSALWCVNARAHVAHNDAVTRFTWGLCATDAHNVIKRTLPLLWKFGANSFLASKDDQGSSISASMDTSLINALWSVRNVAQNGGLTEKSRQLDEFLLKGDVGNVFTGSWIIDMIRQRRIAFLHVMPDRSIINGDVLAIGRHSTHLADASDFIAFLTSYEQARNFCSNVSDAGFPADLDKASQDSLFTSDELKRGFLATIKLSSPLPFHPKMLSIEPIIEDMIVRCYTAKSVNEVASIVSDARRNIAVVESQ